MYIAIYMYITMLCIVTCIKNATPNFQFIIEVKCFHRKLEKHEKQREAE